MGGDLAGNKFEMVLRNMDKTEEEVKPILERFRQEGFVNYFGMQRFGTTGVGTHHVGKALIKSDWSSATEMILKPRPNEGNYVLRRARSVWWETRDAERAYQILFEGRKQWTIEGKLLHGMTKLHKNDEVGALNSIPRQTRQMYVHAYQSYVWNCVVSRRLKEYGSKVLEGDLVKTGEDVEVVTGDVSGVDICQVVLPLPGHKVRYPDNVVRTWYEELLKEDDLAPDSFENSVKSYSLPGDYRCFVVKAWDVSWYTRRYNDINADITKSDIIRLKEKEKENKDKKMMGNKDINDKKDDVGDINDEKDYVVDNVDMKDDVDDNVEDQKKKYCALVLSLSLPASSYATIAVREILHMATDKAAMKMMNDYGRDVENVEENVVATM